MMCKKTSSRWAATKALLVVPMVAVALSAFATTVYVPRELQDKVTENSVNSKEYKPAIVEIKGSEIYLNDKLVTAAELEAVIEDYRLQTLIYDENDAESKRTYEAIHNTLKLNRNIDVTYSDGKRPEVSVVRISGDKIYLNDEQITLEQLKAKADAMDKLATIVMHADVNTDAEQLNAVKDAFRHTSHAVKVISENERIAIVDGKVVPYAEMMKIESSSIGNARLTYDYNTLPQGLGISEEAVKKNGAIVITLKKDGQTAVLDNPVKDKVIVFADEQDKGGSKTQSSTITILGNNDNTKMTAIQIDNAGEGGEMKVKVNGKDVPYETLKTIPSEEIGEMKIVKLDGVGTIYVTTKDELEAQTKEFEQKMKDFEKRIPEFEQKMQEFEQAEKQFAKADKDFKQAEKQFAKAEKAFKQMEKDVQQQNPPYIKAEKMPKFRNGDLMLFQNWMQNNVQYPAEAIEKGISGRVVFSFVVEADGSLSSYQLMASPDKILADEVERVFNSSPREWTAGEQDGKKVRVKLTLPVVFAAVADASENVSGQVVDAKGEPFVGVVVQVDGFDERGVVTDAEGRFSISMSKGETLKFSYIGMDTKRVKVDNTDKPISVTMK